MSETAVKTFTFYRHCQFCTRLYGTNRPNSRYCCHTCNQDGERRAKRESAQANKRKKSAPLPVRGCTECTATFRPLREGHICCSKACGNVRTARLQQEKWAALEGKQEATRRPEPEEIAARYVDLAIAILAPDAVQTPKPVVTLNRTQSVGLSHTCPGCCRRLYGSQTCPRCSAGG